MKHSAVVPPGGECSILSGFLMIFSEFLKKMLDFHAFSAYFHRISAVFFRFLKKMTQKIRARFLKKIVAKSTDFHAISKNCEVCGEVPFQELRGTWPKNCGDTSARIGGISAEELKSDENRPKSVEFLKKIPTDFFCVLLKKM